MRLRILFGSLLLVAGLALYALLAMAMAAHLPDSAVIAFAYYAVAGIAWVLPASLVTRWMARAKPYRPPPAA
jgi:hypothetical protein